MNTGEDCTGEDCGAAGFRSGAGAASRHALSAAITVLLAGAALSACGGSADDGAQDDSGAQNDEAEDGSSADAGADPIGDPPAGAAAGMANDPRALELVRTAGKMTAERPSTGTVTIGGQVFQEEEDSTSLDFRSDGADGIALAPPPSSSTSMLDGTEVTLHSGASIWPSSEQLEFRYVDGRGYMGFPARHIGDRSIDPAGTGWIDTSDPDAIAWAEIVGEDMLCLLGFPFLYRPEELLSEPCRPVSAPAARLTELATAAQEVGAVDLDGVRTGHVRFQVPIPADELGGAMEMLVAMMGGATPDTSETVFLHVDAWIDEDGLMRRMVIDETMLMSEMLDPGYGMMAEMYEALGVAAGDGSELTGEALSERAEQEIAEDGIVMLRTILEFHDFDTGTAPIEAPPAELIVGIIEAGDTDSDRSGTGDEESMTAVTDPSAYKHDGLCERAGHTWDSESGICR